MFYILFIIGVLFSFFSQNKKILLIAFSILLALVSFIRYGIGADYFSYEYLYYTLNDSFIDEFKYGLDPQEVGFRVIGSIFKSAGIPFQLYLSIIASINLFFIYKLSVRYSKNAPLAMLLYFCMFYLVWTFSGLRQGLTIAIGLYYLIKCVEENKTMKIIVISILLSFIHSTSIILIVLYFLSKIDFKKRNLIILTILSIIFSVLPLGFLFDYLPTSLIGNKLTPYLNSDSSFNFIDFQGISRLVLLAVAFLFYDWLIKENEFNRKILNIYILNIMIYFVVQFAGELTASRLTIYGRILEIIIISNIYSLYKQKVNKLILVYILSFLSFTYLNKEMNSMKEQSGLISNSEYVIPFVNLYNKDNYIFNNRYDVLINTANKRRH